jgi:hypothetical protein
MDTYSLWLCLVQTYWAILLWSWGEPNKKDSDIVRLNADGHKRRWKARCGMDDSGGTEGSVPAKENPNKYFEETFFFLLLREWHRGVVRNGICRLSLQGTHCVGI